MKRFILLMFLLSSTLAYSRIPEEALTFDFNVETIEMDRWKEEKIERAVELLRRIFATEEFKRKILNHKVDGERRFYFNKGLTNFEIYHKILDGMESLSHEKNNAMDVEIELYADYDSTVLGYTRPSTRRIWMNTKYFNRNSPSRIAANLIHEWLHKLGFDHEFYFTLTRRFSVPYGIGYIVRDMAEELESEEREESFYFP